MYVYDKDSDNRCCIGEQLESFSAVTAIVYAVSNHFGVYTADDIFNTINSIDVAAYIEASGIPGLLMYRSHIGTANMYKMEWMSIIKHEIKAAHIQIAYEKISDDELFAMLNC